jgi:hypothetical protein
MNTEFKPGNLRRRYFLEDLGVRRREGNIEMDLTKFGSEDDWIQLAQDGIQWFTGKRPSDLI